MRILSEAEGTFLCHYRSISKLTREKNPNISQSNILIQLEGGLTESGRESAIAILEKYDCQQQGNSVPNSISGVYVPGGDHRTPYSRRSLFGTKHLFLRQSETRILTKNDTQKKQKSKNNLTYS